MQMLMPRSMPSPEQYWESYRKLGVTQTLDVAAIPIADFLSAAPQPTEDQLRQYFDTWKEIPPAYPGGPGLRQPRRVRVEYLAVDFAQAEKQVAKKPVTDQEVEKYYNDHHEEYRNRPAAGTTPSTPSSTVPPGPSLPLPGTSHGPTGSKTLPGTKSGTVVPPKAAPAGKAHPQPKKTGKDSGKSGALNERSPLRKKTTGDNPARGEMLALADENAAPIELAAADQINEPGPPALPQAPPAKKASQPSASKGPETKGAGTKPPEHKSADTKKSPAVKTPEQPEPEFRPLDEILKREIRDQILRAPRRPS